MKDDSGGESAYRPLLVPLSPSSECSMATRWRLRKERGQSHWWPVPSDRSLLILTDAPRCESATLVPPHPCPPDHFQNCSGIDYPATCCTEGALRKDKSCIDDFTLSRFGHCMSAPAT